MKRFRVVSTILAGALGVLMLTSISTRASAPAAAGAVLHQENRWLTAIVAGDAKTVAAMLAPNFTHITSRGELLHRAQELAALKKESFTMNPSEQTVDFAGDAAVVHGVNTLMQSGKTLARERYTDVYVKQNGTWMALSAQETEIAQ
ncbi:MAG: nuclear transport factor 2 family protein [Candidatus Tumulicola sp.]